MFQFNVPAMTCGGCARAITRAVQTVDPAAIVDADPATKRVSIRSVAEEASITAAMAEAGYPPKTFAA